MTDDTKAFETEAAQTRDRIADTIDELQARLSPKAIVDNAIGSLSSAGTQAVASMRGAATGHPLVLGAAGLAVGIALLARSRVGNAKLEFGDSYAAYADYDDGYAANLAAGEPVMGATRARIDAVQHQAQDAVDDNPLAVIAVGLATGALLGAVVPVSPFEATMFGEVRSRLSAAGDAAIAAAGHEFDPSKLSLAGGTAGMSERLSQSLIAVMNVAAKALAQPVRPGSAA